MCSRGGSTLCTTTLYANAFHEKFNYYKATRPKSRPNSEIFSRQESGIIFYYAKYVCKHFPRGKVFFRRTNGDVIKLGSLFISNSSSCLHLAKAFQSSGACGCRWGNNRNFSCWSWNFRIRMIRSGLLDGLGVHIDGNACTCAVEVSFEFSNYFRLSTICHR